MTKGSITRFLFDHPRSAGQGYFEHLRFAWRVAAVLVISAAAAFVHGVLPFVFRSTAGDRIRALYAQLSSRGNAVEHVDEPAAPHRRHSRLQRSPPVCD